MIQFGPLGVDDCSGDGCYIVFGGDPNTVNGVPVMIKFGMTGNMKRRMYALQTNAPWPLVLLAWMPCGSRMVAAFLERFLLESATRYTGAKRVSGEWFSADPDSMALLPGFVSRMIDLVSDANTNAYRNRAMRRRRWRRVGVEQEVGLRGRQWYLALAEGYFDAAPTPSAPPFALPPCVAP